MMDYLNVRGVECRARGGEGMKSDNKLAGVFAQTIADKRMTPRQKFVEAMRNQNRRECGHWGDSDVICPICTEANIRAACGAWADADCGPGKGLHIEDDITRLTHKHDDCRATVLKEVGID